MQPLERLALKLDAAALDALQGVLGELQRLWLRELLGLAAQDVRERGPLGSRRGAWASGSADRRDRSDTRRLQRRIAVDRIGHSTSLTFAGSTPVTSP
ncbi:MAG TPA: hypothetical protein VI111_04590, partial [Thermoleophilaceae bacterium]